MKDIHKWVRAVYLHIGSGLSWPHIFTLGQGCPDQHSLMSGFPDHISWMLRWFAQWSHSIWCDVAFLAPRLFSLLVLWAVSAPLYCIAFNHGVASSWWFGFYLVFIDDFGSLYLMSCLKHQIEQNGSHIQTKRNTCTWFLWFFIFWVSDHVWNHMQFVLIHKSIRWN